MISKDILKDKKAKPLNTLKLHHDQESGNSFYKDFQRGFEKL